MARVTIEDCLEHMDDRFRIVLAAARRAKQHKWVQSLVSSRKMTNQLLWH